MVFLGLDISLTATGVCTMNTDSGVIEANTIATDTLRGEARLSFIYDKLMQQIIDHIDFACIEGYSYNSQGKQFELGEAGGIARLVLAQKKINFKVIPPQSLKKFVTGNNNADKDEMMQTIINEHKQKFDDDNQYDAYGLATIAQHIHEKITPKERHKSEVLNVLLNPKKKRKKKVRKLVKNSI